MNRYQRQILIPEIGQVGQTILSKSRVLIIGAGGLGHPVLQYLVAMGVGKIGLMDGDLVQESNLHRQILFEKNDIGKNKAICLKEKIISRQDPVAIIAFPFFLDKARALKYFSDFDVIVDGTDQFNAKFLINDVCGYFDLPMIYGSISQFEGQVSVFWRSKGPCYRCLVPHVPQAKIQNCAEAGVIGALPGVIGSIQAIETLKVLLRLNNQSGRFEPLIGRLQTFDFLDNQSRTLRLTKRHTCSCQAKEFRQDQIEEFGSAPTCSASVKELIDVREFEEWQEFHVPEIFHWPLSKIKNGELPQHLKEKNITTICKTGARARQAADVLLQSGFLKVTKTETSIYGYQNRKNESSAT